MAEEATVLMHRGADPISGVTKLVKPSDVQKNKAAGFQVVKEQPKPAAKSKKSGE